MTDCFFIILDLGTTSFGNGSLFTELKANAPLLKYFGPMYIDFDEYPCYSGKTSAIFERNVNESIQCDHSSAYYPGKKTLCTWVNKEIWAMIKTCFPDARQINQCPKSTLCK